MSGLTEALAGALHASIPAHECGPFSDMPIPCPGGANHTTHADLILTALREALVEAIEDGVHDYWRPTKVRVICERCRPEAAAIVARLLGDAK